MKNTPKTIYLNVGYINGDEDFQDLEEVTWCAESNHEHDIEYQKVPESNAELNSFLLTNLLRLPDEHLKSVIQSVYERKPEVFPDYWKTRCELAMKLVNAMMPVSALESPYVPYYEALKDFIKNNPEP